VGGRDMKNLVLLSKSIDFKYYAVRLPFEAQRIDYMRTMDGQYFLTYDISIEQHGFHCNWVESKSIPVFEKGVQFWLLGVNANIQVADAKAILNYGDTVPGLNIPYRPEIILDHFDYRLGVDGFDITREKIAIVKTKNQWERETN
jgi:hypothetical protein